VREFLPLLTMAINHITAVFKAHIPNPSDKLVALALADFANRETGKAWPAVATLERMTSLSERTIRTALQRLVEAGHLTIDRSRGRGHSSRYWLHVIGVADLPISDQKDAVDAPKVDEKGARAAPILNLKGANADPKGANDAIKGAAFAPDTIKPLKKNRKRGALLPAARPSIDEVSSFCVEQGIKASDGEFCYWKWVGNGWTSGTAQIRDWKATILSLKAASYLPSQKTSGAPKQVQSLVPAAKKIKREPERVKELQALICLRFPLYRPIPWFDIPHDVRTHAEHELAQQSQPPPEMI
jgi:hypothetical protein